MGGEGSVIPEHKAIDAVTDQADLVAFLVGADARYYQVLCDAVPAGAQMWHLFLNCDKRNFHDFVVAYFWNIRADCQSNV